MSDKNGKYADFVRTVFDEWIKKLSAAIQVLQNKNKTVSTLSSEDIASFIVTSIEGGIMLSRLYKNEKPLKKSVTAIKNYLKLYKKELK